MCPIFDDSASNRLTKYQKILWVCWLGFKNLLNHTCHNMNFHDSHHANGHKELTIRFWMIPLNSKHFTLNYYSGEAAITVRWNYFCQDDIVGIGRLKFLWSGHRCLRLSLQQGSLPFLSCCCVSQCFHLWICGAKSKYILCLS